MDRRTMHKSIPRRPNFNRSNCVPNRYDHSSQKGMERTVRRVSSCTSSRVVGRMAAFFQLFDHCFVFFFASISDRSVPEGSSYEPSFARITK